jgi:anthranilate phosphoribosyltransferase
MLREAVRQLVEGRSLSAQDIQQAMLELIGGRAGEVEAAAFLTALRIRGETPAQLAAAAEVLRRHMEHLDVGNLEVLDTCGTGGDQTGTLNLSTLAALIVAASGVPVVKHGNRAVSSRSGSADVLQALGVRVDVDPWMARRCLEEAGLAFCFAPRYHPALRFVAPVRQALGFRTIFNLLGPLCNPAGARWHLLGVGSREHLDLLAETLLRLGRTTAFVVHGSDGLDEVTLSGPTLVRRVSNGQVQALTWQPEDFGLSRESAEALCVADAAESAGRIRAVLDGRKGPDRSFVLANAAAALLLTGKAASLPEGVAQAEAALDSGRARDVLQRLVRLTHQAHA